MSTPPVPAWVKPAVLSTFAVIILAYGWSSYSQRYVLTNEPDAVKDSGAVRVESSFSSRDLSPGEEVTLKRCWSSSSSSRHSDFSSLYYLPLLTAINQYQTSYKTCED
jgi:hypothetical protein